jgi:hypothetical protein
MSEFTLAVINPIEDEKPTYDNEFLHDKKYQHHYTMQELRTLNKNLRLTFVDMNAYSENVIYVELYLANKDWVTDEDIYDYIWYTIGLSLDNTCKGLYIDTLGRRFLETGISVMDYIAYAGVANDIKVTCKSFDAFISPFKYILKGTSISLYDIIFNYTSFTYIRDNVLYIKTKDTVHKYILADDLADRRLEHWKILERNYC